MTTRQTRQIELPPMGKPRPRVTRNGGVYYSGGYDKWRQDFRLLFGPVLVGGPLRLTADLYLAAPKTKNRRKLKPAERVDMFGRPCTGKPDIDNALGAIMDALFPDDDTLVVQVVGQKLWADEAWMEITLEACGGQTPHANPDGSSSFVRKIREAGLSDAQVALVAKARRSSCCRCGDDE